MNESIVPILEHAGPFALVLMRASGLMLASPILSSLGVPIQARVLLSVMLAIGIYPLVPIEWHRQPVELDLWSLAPLALSELAVGWILGVLVSIPLLLVQLGGYIMSYQMGLSIAAAYNPELDTSTDAFGQALFYLGATIWLSIGGLDNLLLAMVRTFEHLPMGDLLRVGAPVDLYLGVLTSGMELALRVAAPVVAAVMLMMVAMGAVMRTMPQINVMTVGFPLKILFGIAVLSWSIWTVADVVGDEAARVTMKALDYASGPIGGLTGGRVPEGGP